MALKIIRNDITKMNTEAIVNTASAQVAVGTGCDSAVYQAAGFDELLAYRKEKIGYVPEGNAFLTPGFRLPSKFIIHAVSPLYQGGSEGEEEKLRSCYQSCLRLATENGIKSIAFPLISTGGFGYPKEEGMRIAVDEISAFLLGHDMEVYLVVFDERASTLGRKLFPGLEEYIDRNYILEKHAEEYGNEARSSFGNTTTILRQEDEVRQRDLQRNIPRRPDNFSFGMHSMPAAAPSSAAPAAIPAAAAKAKKQAGPFAGGLSFLKREARQDDADICEDKVMSVKREEEDAFLDFETEHEGRLEERMRHLSDTFSQYLMYLIRDKKMENAEVYKRAIVDKKIFSKIKNNTDYHPQKLTALCLCVGAKLSLDETKDLLARAGYALSPCDKTDVIFSYFIENKIYDMIELDIQLEEHGLPCIIT